jgi:hypothetical protein
MVNMSDGFVLSSRSSFTTRGTWFEAFCATTFLMSCFVGILPLIGWNVGPKYHEFKDVVVGLIQVSFVGSLLFLVLTFLKWKRGDEMIPLYVFMCVFALGTAITTGVWLGDARFDVHVLVIATVAPLGAWVLFGAKRFVDFATVPNRR